jgi:hypothetical protein
MPRNAGPYNLIMENRCKKIRKLPNNISTRAFLKERYVFEERDRFGLYTMYTLVKKSCCIPQICMVFVYL